MIVRSKIRQSWKRPFGIVIEKGDNVLPDTLPGPAMRGLQMLQRAGLIEFLPDPEPVPVAKTVADEIVEALPERPAAPKPKSAKKPGVKKAIKKN